MKNILFAFAIVLVVVSCESKPSLQKYFVEKSESEDFVTVDIAPSFIKADSLNLTDDERIALESVHKLNVLAFTNTANSTGYEQEKTKVKGLLKTGEYDELMKFGSTEMGASIHSLGEGEDIEEFILFVHGKDNGFGVVRVLGDDMTPNNILTLVGLLQKADLDMEQLKPLQGLMKK